MYQRKSYKHLYPRRKWQIVLHEIIFEADTPAGRWFDILLIVMILLSLMIVFLDSVAVIHDKFGTHLMIAEWIFTGLFTAEYILRLACVKKPSKYAVSFYGIIDMVAVLPSYIGLIVGQMPSLIFIRALRVLRIFRVLKMGKFLKEATIIVTAIKKSSAKITVFLTGVMALIFIMGSIMHMVEGPENGFTSIPRSIYWAIVTLTTVGYGDISPQTPLGQFISSLLMITGYGIIAVPTGIVSYEIMKDFQQSQLSTQVCPVCMKEGHARDAEFCKFCGAVLDDNKRLEGNDPSGET